MSPLAKLCPGCHRIHHATSTRCPGCQRIDDQRRHAKSKAHGLTTPHWHALRIATLHRDSHQCQRCHATTRLTVHLDPHLEGNHHIATLQDCLTLCKSCHGTTDAARSHQ